MAVYKEILVKVDKLIFVQQYEQARALLQQCIEANYNDMLPHIRLIELASKAGNLEELRLEHYAKLDGDETTKLTTWFCQTFIEQQTMGNFNSNTVEQYQKMTQQYPEFFPAYFALALVYESLDEKDLAIEYHEKVLAIEPNWHFSYFNLSQLYYGLSENERGDHYFFSFEKLAPYSVYGNFNTHKELCMEFFAANKFGEAAKSIQTLIDWWYDYRNYCPTEIEINCSYDLAKIYNADGNKQLASEYFAKAKMLTESLLKREKIEIKVLIYMGKTLKENKDIDMALRFYLRVVDHANTTPEICEKIGRYFLNNDEIFLATTFLAACYQAFPNNKDLRLMGLVARLKQQSVDVSEYLHLKEQTRLAINSGNFDEIFNLITKLYSQFKEDAEVLCYMGELYNRMGNIPKAEENFSTMYQLDPLFSDSIYRWGLFNIEQNKHDEAKKIIQSGIESANRNHLEYPEFYGLLATIQIKQNQLADAQITAEKALRLTPWNKEYLVQLIHILESINESEETSFASYEHFEKLATGESFNWNQYEEQVFTDFEEHNFLLAFSKLKLEYVYTQRKDVLHYIALYSTAFDYHRGVTDLVKLLNTPIDCPMVLVSIGEIYLEVLKNESAEVFYEMAKQKECSTYELSTYYLGIARIYNRERRESQKALEYAKMSYDLFPEKEHAYHIMQTLGQAYSQSGNLETASKYLKDSIQIKQNILNTYYLSEIYEKQGSQKSATILYHTILGITPTTLEEFKIKEFIQSKFEMSNVDPRLAS